MVSLHRSDDKQTWQPVTNGKSDKADRICAICGEKIGALASRTKLSDGGLICSNCLSNYGIKSLPNNYFNCEELYSYLDDRAFLVPNFQPTRVINQRYLVIDEMHEGFRVDGDIFGYWNLLDYDLLENNGTVLSKDKKVMSVCTSLKVQITLRNAHANVVFIPILSGQMDVRSPLFRSLQTMAQECLAGLAQIADVVKSRENSMGAQAPMQFSAADEIYKLKQLADAGIISQEEFEFKKHQLLGC